ncbi:hypothetical protein Tco_0998017 [Tanacetum coccineum]
MQIEDYLYQKKLHEPLAEAKLTCMKAEDWTLLDRQALGAVRLLLAKNIAYNVVNKKTTYILLKALSNMLEVYCSPVPPVPLPQPANAEVLDGRSDDLNGGVVVVEEVVKWCGGGICGEVVGEMMVQNPWVLVEGVFGRGLEREFVIVDWNFLVVDHSRKLSRDVVLVSVLGNFLGGFCVDELALEAMRYGDQGWDKRRLFIEEEVDSDDPEGVGVGVRSRDHPRMHEGERREYDPIGKSHIGYTNHSIDDVVGKIEVLSSGKTVEHVDPKP